MRTNTAETSAALFFKVKHGGIRFFQDVGTYMPGDTTSHPRNLQT